jgi:hypothetical protein
LKTESVDADSKDSVGVLLVVVLVGVFVAVAAAIFIEMRGAFQWAKTMLHAFKILYPGHIHHKRGVPCIASFPGKFESEWNRVVELGKSDIAEVSVACVFLPMHTPKFGEGACVLEQY